MALYNLPHAPLSFGRRFLSSGDSELLVNVCACVPDPALRDCPMVEPISNACAGAANERAAATAATYCARDAGAAAVRVP